MNSNIRSKYQANVQEDDSTSISKFNNQFNVGSGVNTADLLEYDEAFILDTSKNARIFISGVKQDLILPQVFIFDTLPEFFF